MRKRSLKPVFVFLVFLFAALIGLLVYENSEHRKDMEIYEKNLKEQTEKYEKEMARLEDELSETRAALIAAEEKAADVPEEEIEEVPETDVAENKEYTFEGFDDRFSAYATPDQITTIKNNAAETVKASEYKSISTITCSEYTRYNEEDTRVVVYARLDDKAVLEITYSIRYGTPSCVLSELSQSDLTELEEHGMILGYDDEGEPTETGE